MAGITIRSEIVFEGYGLHTGCKTRCILKPSYEEGIFFKRVDIKDSRLIKVDPDNIIDNKRNTILGLDSNNLVYTIEHFLSAFWAWGINSLIVEVDSPELPILDGSSLPIYKKIEETGVYKYSDNYNDILFIQEEIVYDDGFSYIKVEPYNEFEVTLEIEYPQDIIGKQKCFFSERKNNYKQSVAPARTFVLLSEIIYLIDNKLIKGGSIDSAVIVKDIQLSEEQKRKISEYFNLDLNYLNEIDSYSKLYLSKEKNLRIENELCVHKLLDFIGDLYLINKKIKGKFYVYRPGHKSNVEFAKLIKRKQKGGK